MERPEPAQVAAGLPDTRPSTARRLVAEFDFENVFTIAEGLPEGWVRAQHDPLVPRIRPGYPLTNLAALDRTSGLSGVASMKLPTNGGSTSLMLEAGVVPVFPNADYMVTAQVRTAGLRHARALLSAVMLDQELQPIEASISVSRLAETGGGWEELSIPVWGDFPEASSLRIELELLQPELFEQALLGDDHVFLQDVGGAVWFDDIQVTQLPRLELSTGEPSNLIPAGRTPTIDILIRDLTGDRLATEIRVFDVDGRLVDTWTQRVGSGRTSVSWAPKLDRFGWYRAVLSVRTGASEVGSAMLDFAWLSPSDGPVRDVRTLADRQRFGLVADELHPGLIPLAAELAERSGAGSFELPLWSAGFAPEDAADLITNLIPVVDRLRSQGVRFGFRMAVLPDMLAGITRLDVHDVLSVFGGDEWRPYLTEFLDRFGQRVARWRLGELRANGEAEPIDGELADRARRSFATLVPGPELVVPWPATSPVPEMSGGAQALRGVEIPWPEWLSHRGVEDFVAALASDEGYERETERGVLPLLARAPTLLARGSDTSLPEKSLLLAPIETPGFSSRDRLDELTKRVIQYWRHVAAVPDPIRGHRHVAALRQPWWFTVERRPRLMPMPELIAWRELSRMLSGRVPVGTLPAAEGVTALLFAPVDARSPRGGLVVLWRDDDGGVKPGSAPALEMYLGPGTVVTSDAFGNRADLEPGLMAAGADAPTAQRRIHRVYAGRSPVFVEGIDTRLVRMLSLVRIEDAFLRSTRRIHEREIVIENPFDRPVSGTIVIVEPGGRLSPGGPPDRSWQIRPRRQRFAIAAGGETRIPFDVSFDAAQEAGLHDFVIDLSLTGDRDYGWVRLIAPVEIGLEELKMDVSYDFVPSLAGPDVLVTTRVVNTGTEASTVQLTMFADGYSRQTASVTSLGPGEQAIRRFVLQGGAEALRGKRASVRVTDPDTGARLSKSIVVE
ncbi:MAG: hypothetical protein AAGB51_08800 [Planctomycetota bacterium]